MLREVGKGGTAATVWLAKLPLFVRISLPTDWVESGWDGRSLWNWHVTQAVAWI